MKTIHKLILVLLISLLSMSVTSAYPIAGLTPDQRPAGAPVIKTFTKTAKWYANALHGIQPPYPASFRFLEDQGAWYTPFNHRGMTKPYDIRHWYK